ncbi:MAG: DUF1883 domain-containing protein [Gammaproteobacteria bacterium]|nr:DUF1883 domain-containing protein [Gammaproteobacteria bacterium]
MLDLAQRFLISVLMVLVPFSAFGRVTVQAANEIINGTIEVKAGAYSAYRLQLSKGDALLVKFNVSGGANNKAKVWLLDLQNFQKFKARQTFSYLKGTGGEIKNAAGYSIQIPETNIYYLVVDNQKAWLAKRSVTTQAIRVSPRETEREKDLKERIEKFYFALTKMYEFEDFDVSVKLCGFENAYSNPNITLCWELLNSLSSQQMPNAFTFVLLHEIAHSLMNIWRYPLYDNEDAADELATVMAIMLGGEKVALEAAAWWAEQDAASMARQKLWIDDRHTISPQRARNIVNWINRKDQLMGRWLKFLAPNMKTEMLEAIVAGKLPYKFANIDIARSELALR